jgi:F-type H+-transporting ATPase subunit gamma
MANLKDLKIRIDSVKSTKKITSAMKMVSAAKLRKAQTSAEAARPYAERMDRMAGALARSFEGVEGAPALLAGNGSDQNHLIVVVTSDRGLCGGFNSNVAREAKRQIRALKGEGKTVKVLCLGRKGRDGLKSDFKELIVDTYEDLLRSGAQYTDATAISDRIIKMFEDGEADVCTVIYTKFKSAMTQTVTPQQLIPFPMSTIKEIGTETNSGGLYEYEPSDDEIMSELLPRNIATMVFRALLESNASEHGARMTSMDSATRNAGDMIDNLTLVYNRTRQANITSELIEIISGAEAL